MSACFINVPSQDKGVNPFYDELFRWWNVRLRPGRQTVEVIVESDEEEAVFEDFVAIKADPYQVEVDLTPTPTKAAVTPTPAKAALTPTPGIKAAKVEPAADVSETRPTSPSADEPSTSRPAFAAGQAMSAEQIEDKIRQVKQRGSKDCFLGFNAARRSVNRSMNDL